MSNAAIEAAAKAAEVGVANKSESNASRSVNKSKSSANKNESNVGRSVNKSESSANNNGSKSGNNAGTRVGKSLETGELA